MDGELIHTKGGDRPMDGNKARIVRFLSHYFRGHVPEDDEDIFSAGFVNSLFAMQLVLFVEKEFNITIDNDDLDQENFRTVNAIDNLIERKSALHI
jgi:methoxymalonate biosynthesis acyl carrier protein